VDDSTRLFALRKGQRLVQPLFNPVIGFAHFLSP
jgi:hypothetical protein